MVRYSWPADLRWDNNKEEFIVLHEFRVYYNQGSFIVPAGFTTDLSSIPRWATPIVPKIGHHLQPSVAHDWCYEEEVLINGLPMTKKEADDLFYHSMIYQGVSKSRANLMYQAVRIGGEGKWD